MCIQSRYRQIGIFPSTDPASASPGHVIASFAMSYLGRCAKGVLESREPLRRKAAGGFAVPFRLSAIRPVFWKNCH